MNQNEFEKKIRESQWKVNRSGNKTFINAGSHCVAEVTDCAADEIVENHNKQLNKGAG